MITRLPVQLIEHLTNLVTAESLLICSDFDGTLSPLVMSPHDAKFLPGIKPLLQKLSVLKSTNVAIVSGRSRADLALLTGLGSSVTLVGSHGAELPCKINSVPTSQQSLLLHELQSFVRSMPAEFDGVTLEYKPFSITVHVRQASRMLADQVTRALLSGPCQRSDVYCQLGKEVIELSVVPMNKGSAIEYLRLRCGEGTRVLYLGDDLTDEYAFDVLSSLDLGVKVGAGYTIADYCVDSPIEIRSLLRLLARLRFRHCNPLGSF